MTSQTDDSGGPQPLSEKVKNKPSDKLPDKLLTQLFQNARPFTKNNIIRDAVAGLQLATMNIPQALGYAKIAGMPIVTGFYALLLPLIGFAAFGSSRFLVVGADSATAAILAGGLSPIATVGSAHYVALASTVAILTAGFLILARILKLGFLADFLSHTVLIGFLTGVGFQVGITVLGDILGVEVHSRKTVVQISEILHSLGSIHFPTPLLALSVIAFVLLFSYRIPRFPASLIAVVATVTASWMWNFADHGISLIGTVHGGLPHLGIPQVSWEEIQLLVPLAGSCFVMILAQSAATARVYASRHHQVLDGNADLVGLSVANATAALTGTFVVNGSPTQTAMVESSGSKSQIAQMTTACVVVVVLVFLSGALQYLPRCVLSALVFCTATRLIDLRGLAKIRRESLGEYVLAMITVAIVILIGVEEGIVLAIVLSLLRIVQHSYRPHSGILIKNQLGLWEPCSVGSGNQSLPGLVIYRFGASLFYANCMYFAEEIRNIVDGSPSAIHWVVVDAEAIAQVDYTAARVLIELQRDLKSRGVTLAFARVQPYLRSDMDRHFLAKAIGPENIFPRLHNAVAELTNRKS